MSAGTLQGRLTVGLLATAVALVALMMFAGRGGGGSSRSPEQTIKAVRTNGSGGDAASFGPSQARVTAVAQCLDDAFGAIDNTGYNGVGGVPHAVLAVDIGGYSAAEVDLFASPAAANSGYPGIRAGEATLTTKLERDSVIVYLKPVSAADRRGIEACG